MDMNIYVTEKLMEARLRELRAASERAALLGSARSGRGGIRTVLGRGLIQAGRWMLRGHRVTRREARAVSTAAQPGPFRVAHREPGQ
jgi:hypothetical protein